ncbi:MAG: pyrimidine 5'-nucleotidase [Desulfuromonadales bacterium]|nr:pyrimidine 5'-nucleotidase [Desulfuromonadales bacterium]
MEFILFDLDNTLYSAGQDVCDQVSARIKRYMIEVVGIPLDDVDDLRHSYWKRYGLTMQGLMRHHGVDPEDYLSYVHDVDIADILRPDPDLSRALQSLPLRRAIFTNSTTDHSERVLNALGLGGAFEEIFDIRVANYLPKPFPEPYHAVLDRLGIAASGCIMVDDAPDNLKTAKDLGMGTILVGQQTSSPWIDVAVQEAAEVPHVLNLWIQE